MDFSNLLPVAENVVVGAFVRASTDEEAYRLAQEAIEKVGLSAIANRIASELTSKELRLMELARALAGQPQLLLLDETLAGLGQSEAEELIVVLKRCILTLLGTILLTPENKVEIYAGSAAAR